MAPTSRMLRATKASTGFDAMHLHFTVVYERVEHAHSVGPTPNAGHHNIGQAPGLLENLFTGFLANN